MPSIASAVEFKSSSRPGSSAAAVAAAVAVVAALPFNTTEGAVLLPECNGAEGRGWNQLLPKSKKHRSDQLHEVTKRTNRRMEQ